MNKLEVRSYISEFNAEGDSRLITGLAIPVEAKSELLGGEFYEIISRSALNSDTIMNNDIKVYLNHNAGEGTFARSKYGEGSLRLYVTERGLEFEFDAPKTTFGDALLEGIRRGDYDAISFAFVCGQDDWQLDADGIYTRTILSFDIIDEISILSQSPAYSMTDVNLRSLEDFKAEQRQAEEDKQQIIKKLDEKMQQIDNQLDRYLIK